MPRKRARDRAVVANAHERNAALRIRQAHNGIHQLTIINRPVRLGQKFGRELFAPLEEPPQFFWSEHDWNLSLRTDADDSGGQPTPNSSSVHWVGRVARVIA